MSLLARVRSAAPAALFDRGLSYARAGGVSRKDNENFVVRVAGRADALSVWTDGTDWECSCGAEVSACGHVAAVAFALAEQLVSSAPAPEITYQIRTHETGLVFDRTIPEGAPRRESDADLNRILAGHFGKPGVPRALAQQALGPLRGLGVTLDGLPIECNPERVYPMVIVVDEGEGWRVRLVRRAGIDAAWPNGILKMGNVLHPMGESDLDQGLRQRLVQGMAFSSSEAGRLATEFIPALRKVIEVEVRSSRVPTGRRDPPRLQLEVEPDGHQLTVTARIVYGDPPYARVEHGELRRLDARMIPTRDVAAERRLLDRGIPVGVPIEREAGEAARWVAALPGVLREEVLRRAPGFRLVRGEKDPELQVEGEGETYRVHLGNLDGRGLVAAWRNHDALVPLLDGGWRPIPREWMEKHGAVLAELLDSQDEGGGKIQRAQAPMLAQALEQLGVDLPPRLEGLRALAGDFSSIPVAVLSDGFRGQLRPYQQRGVDWIAWLRSIGMGGILADDMGLGKTVQVLASLGPGRHLVVAPTSVVRNWEAEAGKFRPDLRVCVYHGPRRQLDSSAQLVVTTWAVLRLDLEALNAVEWTTVAFDEAQALKNPESQTADAARRIRGQLRLCVSGTPVENRLDELWSAMHVANPGLLGSRRSFRDRFATPIDDGNRRARDELRRRIRPFTLRRTKAEAAPDLPSRTDVVLRCTLSENERSLYESVKSLTSAQASAMLSGGKSHLQVLEVLLRMRQAACHPGLLPGKHAGSSAKLALLLETLDEVIAEGHRALVFSQWTSMLDLVEAALAEKKWGFVRLDGSTIDRAGVVARFNAEDGPPVFLLSLKAGGTGLNLTAADYVFHLDPWWNPAVEDQATDRAHRIGQTRPVVSIRLVAEDTVEERILALQDRKRDLVRAALDEGALAQALTSGDLAGLFD